MSNAIIKLNDEERSLVSHFGSTDSFNFLMERQAEIYQVPMADVDQYADVRGALVKATQMSWTYGVMPGKHIYLIPFNKREGNIWRKTYAVADSYEWRKASADAKAQENGWRYMVQSELLSGEDVQKYVEENNLAGAYHVTDCGYRARVLLWHEIEITKAMGAEYSPPWHYGFWRKNAQQKSGKNGKYWEADNVPAGRTPEWVAMKRAEKSALAQHFELRALSGWSQKSESQRSAAIQDHITAMLPEPEPAHHTALLDRQYDEEFYAMNSDEPEESEAQFVVKDRGPEEPSVGQPAADPERDGIVAELWGLLPGVYKNWKGEAEKIADGVTIGRTNQLGELDADELSKVKAIALLEKLGSDIYGDDWRSILGKMIEDAGYDVVYVMPLGKLRQLYKSIMPAKKQPA